MEKRRSNSFSWLKILNMKKIIPIALGSFYLLILACNNKAEKQETETIDSTKTVAPSSWTASLNDSSGRLEMKKNEFQGPDSLTASSVIKFLNMQNPSVQLVFVKQSSDTLYIKIPAATFLTQQMGSTGATMYLANAVYNLTEIPGIAKINFDFEEGDHASPGTLTRESFRDE